MSFGADPALMLRTTPATRSMALRVSIGARGANPNVEPATLPFKPTVKRPEDVVITNIGRK